MKKRIFILLLCVLLLLSPLHYTSASTGVNYISINDTLPPDLVNTFIYYSGTVYVPCWLFNSYSLGVYYSYIESNNTAHLYQNSVQLFFETDTGLTYDGNGNYYSLPGIMQNGVIYVPISYVSAFFGSFYYTVTSTQYGSVLRLKDSRVVLSDTEFFQAAAPQMQQYYLAHKPSSTPGSANPNGDDLDHEGTELLLSFTGLPGEMCLELLKAYNVKACFFLTAEDVIKSPDTIRRIACEGHSLGVLCGEDPERDYAETSALIFEAARVHTILVSSDAEFAELCGKAAREMSLVYCEREIDAVHTPDENSSPYVVTSALDVSEYGASIFISSADDMADYTRAVLSYLTQNKYAVSPPTETMPEV